MEIRDIQNHELDELLNLYRHLHEKDDPPPAREVLVDIWERIQADEKQRYFGAFLDEQLVSSCVLCVIPNLTRGCRPYGLIENVVSHPDHRRMGYGKAVLEFALQYAWDHRCYKVMLLTGRKNQGTFMFYESAGFDRHSKQAFLAKDPKSI